MLKETAILSLLTAQQQEWRARFPDLTNRVQQSIVGYLCTRGRPGVPVRQIYGVTKELFLLDDATVRERIEDIHRLGLCDATPPEPRMSGRTIVAPTPNLLNSYDAYLLSVLSHMRTALRDIDATRAGTPPARLSDRDRTQVLAVFDAYAMAWLAAADRFLVERALSPARRTEARRRLTSTSYWILMHRALDHAHQLQAGRAGEDSLIADQLAALVLDQTGQSFQTVRDHISWLISTGLLHRHPGRVLRVSLEADALPYFNDALRTGAAEAAEAAARLGMAGPATWPLDDDTADQTIRLKMPPGGRVEPSVQHWLEIAGPTDLRVPLAGLTLIGRAPPAQVLLADGAVSRSHCQIEVEGEDVVLSDLNSTNGTWLEGERIARPVPLADGATLRIGPYTLVYRREEEGG